MRGQRVAYNVAGFSARNRWVLLRGTGAGARSGKELTMSENIENFKGTVVDDFIAKLDEAQDMLKRAASETGDKARDLRAQVETKLLQAKLRLQELEDEAVDRTKAAARATDDYIHDNPWQVIGVAAAVGVLVGLLMSRRS